MIPRSSSFDQRNRFDLPIVLLSLVDCRRTRSQPGLSPCLLPRRAPLSHSPTADTRLERGCHCPWEQRTLPPYPPHPHPPTLADAAARSFSRQHRGSSFSFFLFPAGPADLALRNCWSGRSSQRVLSRALALPPHPPPRSSSRSLPRRRNGYQLTTVASGVVAGRFVYGPWLGEADNTLLDQVRKRASPPPPPPPPCIFAMPSFSAQAQPSRQQQAFLNSRPFLSEEARRPARRLAAGQSALSSSLLGRNVTL